MSDLITTQLVTLDAHLGTSTTEVINHVANLVAKAPALPMHRPSPNTHWPVKQKPPREYPAASRFRTVARPPSPPPPWPWHDWLPR